MQALYAVSALSRFEAAHTGTDCFSIVNPDCTTPQADTCPFFKADQKDRYALGITQLLDDLPHNKAIAIKRAMNTKFSKGTLYRIQKKND